MKCSGGNHENAEGQPSGRGCAGGGMARCSCPWDHPQGQRENAVPMAQGRPVQAWDPLAPQVPFRQFTSALSPRAMQRGDERSDCSLTPLARNRLRSAARSNAPSSCLGGGRGGLWSPTLERAWMKHSLPGAEAPFVHRSYNHPNGPPGTILGTRHSYIFRTLALLGEKEGSRNLREPLL